MTKMEGDLEIFSENVQGVLVLLCAFREKYGKGELFRGPQIPAVTGMNRKQAGEALRVCFMQAALSTDGKKNLIPGGRLEILTLYDIIKAADGWVHIGNASQSSLRYGHSNYSGHLTRCERNIGEGIYEYLKSTRLLPLLDWIIKDRFFRDSAVPTLHEERVLASP